MAIIKKSDKVQIRIQMSDFTGEPQVDIRTYVKTDKMTDFIATSKGVSFEPSMLDSVIEALLLIKEQRKSTNSIPTRYAIAKKAKDIVGKPPYSNLSKALTVTGVTGDFIFEVQKVENKTLKVSVFEWKKDTWIEL